MLIRSISMWTKALRCGFKPETASKVDYRKGGLHREFLGSGIDFRTSIIIGHAARIRSRLGKGLIMVHQSRVCATTFEKWPFTMYFHAIKVAVSAIPLG